MNELTETIKWRRFGDEKPPRGGSSWLINQDGREKKRPWFAGFALAVQRLFVGKKSGTKLGIAPEIQTNGPLYPTDRETIAVPEPKCEVCGKGTITIDIWQSAHEPEHHYDVEPQECHSCKRTLCGECGGWAPYETGIDDCTRCVLEGKDNDGA